jgi:hypothetical protein
MKQSRRHREAAWFGAAPRIDYICCGDNQPRNQPGEIMQSRLTETDVTPKHLWLNRRALLAGGTAGHWRHVAARWRARARRRGAGAEQHGKRSPPTTISMSSAPARTTRNAMRSALTTEPWSVEIDGLVAKPGTYDLDAIRAFRPRSASIAFAVSRRGRW